MAKRKAATGLVTRQPRQHSLTWLQGLLCGAMVTLATPTALLLGVILGPALLAVLLDHEPGRPRAYSTPTAREPSKSTRVTKVRVSTRRLGRSITGCR